MAYAIIPKVDWRKHPSFFRCRCEKCRLSLVGPLDKAVGKFWQRGYGESNKAFRSRVMSFHRVTDE